MKNVIIPPYALMDLDDTLFQTWRKIEQWQLSNVEHPTQLTVATVNQQGLPLSFFTTKQKIFFDWLQNTTELIPVTARDREEIKRVQLNFHSWQVLTHGAVILQQDGQILTSWQRLMAQKLSTYQPFLTDLMDQLHRSALPVALHELKITPHFDDFLGKNLMIYIAIKHQQKRADRLWQLADWLTVAIKAFHQHCYVHINANNLAILPHVIHKAHAVKFLQQHHLDTCRPSFGFGDSLADLPFLQLLDWYGTPKQGQLHDKIQTMTRFE